MDLQAQELVGGGALLHFLHQVLLPVHDEDRFSLEFPTSFAFIVHKFIVGKWLVANHIILLIK